MLGALSVLAIGVGTSMLAAAGLGFLGLGAAEPTPEWGLMLSGGRNVLVQAWWIALFPGLAIMLTVLATAVVGRTLRARAEGGTMSLPPPGLLSVRGLTVTTINHRTVVDGIDLEVAPGECLAIVGASGQVNR